LATWDGVLVRVHFEEKIGYEIIEHKTYWKREKGIPIRAVSYCEDHNIVVCNDFKLMFMDTELSCVLKELPARDKDTCKNLKQKFYRIFFSIEIFYFL